VAESIGVAGGTAGASPIEEPIRAPPEGVATPGRVANRIPAFKTDLRALTLDFSEPN